jgi:pSer/pThr/pTyr-binding forkhead associated (FHA) protein
MSGNGLYMNHTGVLVPGAPPPNDIVRISLRFY